MKKLILLTSLVLYCFCLHAQITLTLADMPSAGDSQSVVDADDVSMVSVGAAGPNQTYDFSGLSGVDTTVSNFIAPAGTPGAAVFASADLAIESEGDYTYIDVTSSELNFLGATVDTASAGPPSYFSLVFDPSQKVFEIPTTYGTNFTDESGFSITADASQAGFDSVRITTYMIREINYDGYGTVITPLGSFSGLREKVINTSYDTTEVLFFGTWQVVNTMTSTDTYYNWYSKDSKGPLVSVDFENGTVLSASYQILTPTVVAPVAAFSYTDQGGGTLVFTDQSTNFPTSWLWDFGDGNTSTQQNPQHTYTTPGTYTVCLTVTNSAGSNTICQDVTIVLAPMSAFTFTNQGEGLVDFTDQSTNQPATWLWDFGDGNTSAIQNPQHTFASTGMFTVCLTVTNSVGSDESCQTVDVMVTAVDDFSDQFTTTVFPNPVDDALHLSIESDEVEELQFKMFTSTGQLVFSNSVNSPGQYTFQVKDFAPGVYFYFLSNKEGRIAANGKLMKE